MVYEVVNFITLKQAVDELCAFLLSENVSPERIFDSKLVAYELLGNVLKHADGNAKLGFRLSEDFVELTIHSAVSFYPEGKGRCSDVFAENGRGLFLVDRVAERSLCEDGGMLIRIKLR